MQAAAEKSKLAAELLDSKRVFTALAWRALEALQLIQQAQAFEEMGADGLPSQ